MELIKYLNSNFYTKQELLDITQVKAADFAKYQQQGVMPRCSYKLNLAISSDSFFGVYEEKQQIEYYAKGYASWLGIIQSLKTRESIYSTFSQRYINTINRLKEEGHISDEPKVNEHIDLHIEEEWKHFLDGIYGLCTQSGLPEDIAAKELAILEINELSGLDNLTEQNREKLMKAVNLLDVSSSMFAPHERLKSSRHRLINEVRRQYRLTSNYD
ncbi:DUF6058 family natural product biosynthesis protein [Aliikangiella sp. IMCC44359]|uniref:DUF6058 family natural product biosynthesis protein n=1 Tax=Aliikangiella sp. IMCC44359 TaxID=3459125 RepID=UPI00403AB859